MAVQGWENRLYTFLSQCKTAKITRIDIAHDDFNGDYSDILWADQMESQDMFMLTNNRPKVQHLGDWKHHRGDGRTLQIGIVQNGKCQINYEKGKQLGDKSSQWLRAECRIGNQNKKIPFDILLRPTDYFCGFYPYNELLIQRCIDFKQKQSEIIIKQDNDINSDDDKNNGNGVTTNSIRIPVISKTAKISLEKSIKIWQKQIGRYITAFREFFKDDKIILDLLQSRKKGEYPKRLAHFEKQEIKDFLPPIIKEKINIFQSAKNTYENLPQSERVNFNFDQFIKSDNFLASIVGLSEMKLYS